LFCLADIYSLNLEPSMSPSTSDESIQMPFVLDGWP